MNTLHAIKLGGEVHKDRSVATGAYSLNGHDSSHVTSAKKTVLKVPTSGCKTTYMQLTDSQIPACQNTSPVFLFGDCMTFHSKLSLCWIPIPSRAVSRSSGCRWSRVPVLRLLSSFIINVDCWSRFRDPVVRDYNSLTSKCYSENHSP